MFSILTIKGFITVSKWKHELYPGPILDKLSIKFTPLSTVYVLGNLYLGFLKILIKNFLCYADWLGDVFLTPRLWFEYKSINF